jgi:hypothetical protein
LPLQYKNLKDGRYLLASTGQYSTGNSQPHMCTQQTYLVAAMSPLKLYIEH